MLTAEQINEFKRRKRRRWPAAGGGILAEHGKKTINPLLNVKDHAGLVLVDGETPEGVTPSTSGNPIPAAFDEELIAEVDKLAAESMTGNSSSCRGACTGLCLGTCTSSCSGCSGSCSGSCGGSCGSHCSGCDSCTGCGSSCGSSCGSCLC